MKQFNITYSSLSGEEVFQCVVDGKNRVNAVMEMLEQINQGKLQAPIIQETEEVDRRKWMFKNDTERMEYLENKDNWFVAEENLILGTRIEVCKIGHIEFVSWYRLYEPLRGEPTWSKFYTMHKLNGKFTGNSLTGPQMVNVLKGQRDNLK